MDGLVARGLKACLLFVLMYFSLTFVGCSPRAAAIAGSIPLVLGLLNVLTGTAFSIAGVVFIGAALTALLPAEYRDVPKLVRTLVADVARDESVPLHSTRLSDCRRRRSISPASTIRRSID